MPTGSMSSMTIFILLLVVVVLHYIRAQSGLTGLLYPRESPTRERKVLSGVWNFRLSPYDNQTVGFDDNWYLQPLEQTGPVIPMPVPSSFNDITQQAAIRDYVGWVWYDFEFFVSERYRNESLRHVLYFGSAQYSVMVWLNGVNVLNHSIGHLPFEAEVTNSIKYGLLNRVTVALNNQLTRDTVPQGSIQYFNDSSRYPPGFFEVSYPFDFMNYAGIDRPVYLYSTPVTYIEDITLTTDIQDNGTTGIINYEVNYVSSSSDTPTCYVEVYARDRTLVAQVKGLTGNISLDNANLWWPYLMEADPGYRYTLKFVLNNSEGQDIYYQPVGIRTVSWTNTSFLINGKSFYFRGFGKHEDYDIRGKGVDNPTIIKDFNLIKWVGANSFRTSHYPYADEIMDRADEEGIVIIDESPACTLGYFGNQLLDNHKQAMAELIRRDKNRPSVVMWSLANEPQSAQLQASAYFKDVSSFTRSIDPTGRPLTVAISASVSADLVAQYLDIVSVNRYYAWYQDTGHLEVIPIQLQTEYAAWHDKHNKPVMITEYGAEAIAGLHVDPPFVFTEEYQATLYSQNFVGFDKLRATGFFVGEMVWNFADFMTPQVYTRVMGNKKGIFTRQRQPKMGAWTIRARYWSLAKEIDGAAVPNDVGTTTCSASRYID